MLSLFISILVLFGAGSVFLNIERDEKKKEMLNFLKFPALNIEKTQVFLENLSQSGSGILAKMIHKDDSITKEEIEERFKSFNDDRHYLNINLQRLVKSFFKGYLKYFRENDLTELKPIFFFEISSAPAFVVIIKITLRKSTVLPL